jgi:AcrR family transcriptional regulator
MPRTYQLKRRAEQQQETRRRIVAATVELHEEVGVLRTTVSDIAARAGVERATVYRHFRDDHELIAACTGHYLASNSPPDPSVWEVVHDPAERFRTALIAIYAYHRQTERMADRAERDLPDAPVLAEVLAPLAAHWDRVRDTLSRGWPTTVARSEVIEAAIGHAIAFSTWRSLVRVQGLDDTEAAEVMAAMMRGLADPGSEAG